MVPRHCYNKLESANLNQNCYYAKICKNLLKCNEPDFKTTVNSERFTLVKSKVQ